MNALEPQRERVLHQRQAAARARRAALLLQRVRRMVGRQHVDAAVAQRLDDRAHGRPPS